MTDTADLREPLNPKQEEVLFELLGQRDKHDRPEFAADLALDLHAHIERGLEEVRPKPPHDPVLSVTKYDVSGVLDCEARWNADQGFDGWTIEMLTGTVVHRAVEHYFVHVHGVKLSPLALVDHILEWMAANNRG